ncbi:minor capsid protein [Bacillus toyonensis]|uniref:minor capsid protein n=1 Tax=Bacillus toyonensis TaxID=155322 RepID=UPI000BF01A88|nr:minor capsid protein [Bacillus toyonensis]PEI49945.1 minor capsid protein [Bacillus toyonensis]
MIRVNVRVDTSVIEGEVMDAVKEAQFTLDEQVIKDSNFFIPKDTGELERSALRFSRPGEGHVEWNVPYARRLYYNPQYDFSTDVNENAQGLWFEEAKSRYRSDWARIVENDIKRNL